MLLTYLLVVVSNSNHVELFWDSGPQIEVGPFVGEVWAQSYLVVRPTLLVGHGDASK
jgi:hypothetical protein